MTTVGAPLESVCVNRLAAPDCAEAAGIGKGGYENLAGLLSGRLPGNRAS